MNKNQIFWQHIGFPIFGRDILMPDKQNGKRMKNTGSLQNEIRQFLINNSEDSVDV